MLYLVLHTATKKEIHRVTKDHLSFPKIIHIHKCHILILYHTGDQELKHNEKMSACGALLTHPHYLNCLVKNFNTFKKLVSNSD